MQKPIYLVVTDLFPTLESFRGPYVYDQVRAIQKDGRYEVVVVRPTTRVHKDSDYEYEGVNVHRFVTYDLPSNMWPGANNWLSLRSFDKCLKRIGIKHENIAVVHAHVIGNACFANYVRTKNVNCFTVLQHHGYDVLGLRLGKFHAKEWHKRQVLRYGIIECNKIDLHLGVSKKILEYLESYEGIKLKDKYVLYNGVDTSKFFPISSKLKELENNPNPTTTFDDLQQNLIVKGSGPSRCFSIGCVANFWELKDQITLIKAVEILVNEGYENVKVLFVGSGYTREGCEHYVKDHGLIDYFEFNNEVDHSQLNAYYNKLDLFVLPSYWDSFGCVYTEAYACGVPFMTAKGTGITELIPKEDFHKWVIEPHDYIALARNIKLFMKQSKMMPIEMTQPLNTPINITELVTDYLNYIY